jgi:hypothetical protein
MNSKKKTMLGTETTEGFKASLRGELIQPIDAA